MRKLDLPEIKHKTSYQALKVREYVDGRWTVIIGVTRKGRYMEIWYSDFLVTTREITCETDSQNMDIRVTCHNDKCIGIRCTIDEDTLSTSVFGVELEEDGKFLLREVQWTQAEFEYRIKDDHLYLY